MKTILSPAFRTAFATVSWRAVACYYVLACAISFALRNVPHLTKSWLPYHTIFAYGLGPIGAALLCRRFFPSVPLTVSVLGTSPGRVLLTVGLPIWLACLFGMANKRGLDPHLFGGMVTLAGVVAAMHEWMNLIPTKSPLALGLLVAGWVWMLWRWDTTLLPARWLRSLRMAAVGKD